MVTGDPGWIQAWWELRNLHCLKASTYGTNDDPLANYVITSAVIGEADEFTPAIRIQEKIVRAINLLKSGRADECDEWMDIAALALGAEALKRRRQDGQDGGEFGSGCG